MIPRTQTTIGGGRLQRPRPVTILITILLVVAVLSPPVAAAPQETGQTLSITNDLLSPATQAQSPKPKPLPCGW